MKEDSEILKLKLEIMRENARIGYQAAISLHASRVSELWSQFGSFMTANTIVIAAATLLQHGEIPLFTFGMPIVGIVLCITWLMLHTRGVSYVEYYMLSARELEEQYLNNPLVIISRGGKFASNEIVSLSIGGKPVSKRIKTAGRIMPVRWVAYLAICIFILMYTLIIIFYLS